VIPLLFFVERGVIRWADTFAVVEACSVQFDRYKCGAQSMNYYET
jgi:hypothetical protein